MKKYRLTQKGKDLVEKILNVIYFAIAVALVIFGIIGFSIMSCLMGA